MFNHKLKLTGAALRALLGSALIAGCAGLLLAGAARAEEGKNNVSPKMAKPLKAAQDDLTAKKYADAIAKLKEAEGTAGKSPYDQHVVNDMLGFAYIRTQNFPEAAKALEAELNDGFTPPADMPTRVRALVQINYQIKNYDKAIEYGTRAIKSGDGSPELDTLVGQAYYLKRDYRGAQMFCEERVKSEIDRGWTPKKESLRLLYSACRRLNDDACAKQSRNWHDQYYPQELWEMP